MSPETTGQERWLTTGKDWFQDIGNAEDGNGATRIGHTLLGYYDEPNGGNKAYDENGRAIDGQYWDGNYSMVEG